METHRYSRKHVSGDKVDAYNSLSSQNPTQHSNLEYWTNGTTTHLMSTARADHVPTRISKRKISKDSFTNASKNVVRNSILAGSIAGMGSTIIVYPFDVVRTKLQTAAQSGTRLSPWQALSHTHAHGGIRALYTGLSLPLMAQAVYKATIFSANNVCQSALVDYRTFENLKRGKRKKHKLTLADYFVCGFVSGAVNAAIFVTPVEYVRNQLIVQHTKLAGLDHVVRRSGPLDVIRGTVRSQGVTGLWRGVGLTVARDSFGCGFFFVSMAYCRKLFHRAGEPPSWGVTVASGMSAGIGFWVVALPLDTLKTWVQNGTSPSASRAVQESVETRGWLRTAYQLCRGWQVAFGRGAPSAAITIATYEYFYQKLDQL